VHAAFFSIDHRSPEGRQFFDHLRNIFGMQSLVLHDITVAPGQPPKTIAFFDPPPAEARLTGAVALAISMSDIDSIDWDPIKTP
jgi:hypothetical protein